MLPSAVSVLVVAQSSSEIPEGLMNNPIKVVFIVLLVLLYRYEISVDTFSGSPVGYTGLCKL